MSMQEAKLIIEEYNLSSDEQSLQTVLEVLQKFGSAKAVLIEGLKPKYQYLKKLSKLLAMLEDVQDEDDSEAERIVTLMHDIYKVVLRDAEHKGEPFLELMRRINVRETFKPTPKELWVMQYLGGRELIANITYEEPNKLLRDVKSALQKYETLSLDENALLLGQDTKTKAIA